MRTFKNKSTFIALAAIGAIILLISFAWFAYFQQDHIPTNESSMLQADQTEEESSTSEEIQANHLSVNDITEYGGSEEPLDVPVFMFEEDYIPRYFSAEGNSSIAISDQRFRDGKSSLRWNFNAGSSLVIKHPIGFKDLAQDTFGIWIYNETPIDGTLTFEFGRNGRTDASFPFHLNYHGWRTAWVPFRDMDGAPHQEMNTLVINAPDTSGTIYIDQIVLSTPVDARYPTRDMQVPFVNLEADTSASAHWQALYLYDELMPRGDDAIAADVTEEERHSIALLEQNFTNFLSKNMTVSEGVMQKIRSSFRQFKIENDSGLIRGRPVQVIHIEDIYPSEMHTVMRYRTDAINIIDYSELMLEVANRFHFAEDEAYRRELKNMFIDLSLHLQDQGWVRGHSMGTTHHLGYNTRSLYSALFLMRDVLAEAGLKSWAQEMMAWFSGLGRIYEPFEQSYANADILNTKLQGMLASILMLDHEEQKVFHLRRFTQWLNHGLMPAPGLMPAFKVDGSGYHHMGFYPAYTRDAFRGLTPVIMILSNTAYRISEEAHETVKKALMNSRLYANTHEMLVSAAGRHPTGKEKIVSEPFKYLALAGTPDGSEEIDREVAAAYLRLVEPESVDQTTRMLREMGYEAEAAPNGHWTMNYGALALHRRDDWLVGVRGHNRYLWAGELYANANWYGRYTTYGQIQIMSGKNNLSSGFVQNGWDWNRWPGTTAKRLPLEELKASSFTEMLLTDETYAGGLNLQGENGMFAMKLHEHPKYDQTHRARKSVFMFDNRIIALGTDIENEDEAHYTETTLFQNYLSNEEEGIWAGSEEAITVFPYEDTLTLEEDIWLIDNKQNGYYIPTGHTIGLHKKLQHSNDQSNGKPTKGNFATAWISHGKAPKNERYEYAIIIGADVERMKDFVDKMNDEDQSPYQVLQQDTNAHIVWDRETNITAYALFEANDQLNQKHIIAADTPSMVMIKEEANAIIMSAVDPDLRLYEGIDPDQYNQNGEFTGRGGVYTRPWRFNESQMHTMTFVLRGEWALETEGSNYRIVSRGDGQTIIEVDSKDAMPIEFTLIKAD